MTLRLKEINWLPLLVAVALVGLFAWAGYHLVGPGSKDDRQAALVIALKPDKDPDFMLEARTELAAVLSASLNRPVEVVVPLSGAVIQEGLANGSIDIAFVSATDAWNARRRGVADVLLAGAIDGSITYWSYWVALKESPLQKVEDLRGQPIAFASRTSTSGMAIPVWDLYKRGLFSLGNGPEEFFGAGNIQYGVGYSSAVQRVLDGQAVAAAVSDYVLDGDRHLTPGQRERLRILARQGPVPTHVLIYRASMRVDEVMTVKNKLIEISAQHADLSARVFNGSLVPVDVDKHLAPIQSAQELQLRLMGR